MEATENCIVCQKSVGYCMRGVRVFMASAVYLKHGECCMKVGKSTEFTGCWSTPPSPDTDAKEFCR